MRGFLINKNLCLYYWLRKRIGKERAYRVSRSLEKVILVLGRPTRSISRSEFGKGSRTGYNVFCIKSGLPLSRTKHRVRFSSAAPR